ncbi:PEP-CTERM sorting domain-containing protein [Janthinobacterium sp. PC23-8]|uniref:PEP-CTERM sorting domain-containing protein n=1 Tax=Janthinobacterium sp. PC23-8 TaxID=2012679 RepID=UPI000B971494|nr:PEP-CTERM sorting domain-containing protein [Janthinobacterium sp. PC23-8]OYO30045.1 hypothetical protein CD932_02010 [Janthinobacterium sp. PC23-8]
MKNLSQWVLSLIAVGVFAHANASTTTISTGYFAAGAQKSAAAYKSVVDAAVARPTVGYGSKTVASYSSVDNSSLFGSSKNVAFRSTIDFGVSAAQAGPQSCCDGFQQAQFTAANSSVASVSATDGPVPVSPVAEPSTYVMLLVGLGLLVFTTGQKQPDVFRA